ncbi:TetR family transcriptional regulator [Curtobacterium sp. 1P10AnD]|uniref:TetR/AcrR family transcriptional regulator n=1 Tax=Curtobacterium sp. 1P10AnD TaxID=3132283 RepID=UPI00399FECF7
MSDRDGRRADAVRNRARVLDAAVRLVSVQGADVPFTAIAAAAGVGVGTVYRHFPSRIALFEAVYRNELDAVCDAATQLEADEEPADALRTWLDRFVDYLVTKAGLSSALTAAIAGGAQPFEHSRGRLNDALQILLAALQRDGRLRDGVASDDVLLLVAGTALVSETSGTDRRQRDRLLDLVVTAVVA